MTEAEPSTNIPPEDVPTKTAQVEQESAPKIVNQSRKAQPPNTPVGMIWTEDDRSLRRKQKPERLKSF